MYSSNMSDLDRDVNEELVNKFLEMCQDPVAWSWNVEGKTQEMCGRIHGVYQEVLKGAITSLPVFCNTWNCSKCAPIKAKRFFRYFAAQFGQYKQIYWTSWVTSEPLFELRTRIRQRAKKKGANYLLVARNNRRIWIFATQDLSGREEPCELRAVEPKVAVRLLMPALKVPGIPPHGISYSRAWTPEDQPKERRFRLLGYAKRETLIAALDELGTGLGQPPPEGMSAEEYAGQLMEKIRELERDDHDFSKQG